MENKEVSKYKFVCISGIYIIIQKKFLLKIIIQY